VSLGVKLPLANYREVFRICAVGFLVLFFYSGFLLYSNCHLPENPLHISCEVALNPSMRSMEDSAGRTEHRRHLANYGEKISRFIDVDNVVVKRVARGVYFSASDQFQVLNCVTTQTVYKLVIGRQFPL